MDSLILLASMGVALVVGLLIGFDEGKRVGMREGLNRRSQLYYLPRGR